MLKYNIRLPCTTFQFMKDDSHGRSKNNTNTYESLYELIQKSTTKSIKNIYKLQPKRYKLDLIDDNYRDDNSDNNGNDKYYIGLFIFMSSYSLYYYYYKKM